MPARALRNTALLGLVAVLGCPKQSAPEPPKVPEVEAPPINSAPAAPEPEPKQQAVVDDVPDEVKELQVQIAGRTVRLDRDQLEVLRTKLLARIEQSELPDEERTQLAERVRTRSIHISEDGAYICGFRLFPGGEPLTLDMRTHTTPHFLWGYRAEVTRKDDAWEVGPLGRYTVHARR